MPSSNRPKKKPGSKKGKPKPLRRTLDPDFSDRLRTAMAMKGLKESDVPYLAQQLQCTRMTLHNYLKSPKQRKIDAHILLDLAEFTGANARWLLSGDNYLPPWKRISLAITPKRNPVSIL